MGKFYLDKETGTMKPVSEVQKMKDAKPAIIANDGNTADRVSFHATKDLKIIQFVDERSNEIMGFMSGYALDVQFNPANIRTMEALDNLVESIGQMFKRMILENTLKK